MRVSSVCLIVVLAALASCTKGESRTAPKDNAANSKQTDQRSALLDRATKEQPVIAKPSPEQLAEFKRHLQFFRAISAWQEKKDPGLRARRTLPDGRSQAEATAAQMEELVASGTVPLSEILIGARQSTADVVSTLRDASAGEVRAMDAFLAAAGAPSLSEMRSIVNGTLVKILKQGAILNIDEFYVAKNAVDDGDPSVSKEEAARLDRMMSQYEEQMPQ
jgi:hypothetical protein